MKPGGDASAIRALPPCSDAGSCNGGGKNDKATVDPKTKAAVSNVRRAHSAWDKARRDWHSMVQQGQAHDNARGCKFESDLTK